MYVMRDPLSLRLWFALAVAALALLATACGGGDGDEEAVEETIRAVADAWNGKDADALLGLVTDNFLSAELDATREEASAELPQFIGDPRFDIQEISAIAVSDDTATGEVVSIEENVVSRERFSFVTEGDQWKVDGTEQLGAEIPDGVTAVDLETREYAFEFDESAAAGGNIAFSVSNVGGEQHFVDIVKVPADFDVEQALRSEQEPEGIEEIGGTEPLGPGQDTTLVFAEPLEPGRYVMVCFIEAADGEPHALKGMWSEFTVE